MSDSVFQINQKYSVTDLGRKIHISFDFRTGQKVVVGSKSEVAILTASKSRILFHSPIGVIDRLRMSISTIKLEKAEVSRLSKSKRTVIKFRTDFGVVRY